jgi:hypothetical protein
MIVEIAIVNITEMINFSIITIKPPFGLTAGRSELL